jgi:hypothetical protein
MAQEHSTVDHFTTLTTKFEIHIKKLASLFLCILKQKIQLKYLIYIGN